MLASSDYALIALMVAIAVGMAVGILVLTHLVGPRRSGPLKESTYESGVEPFGDTRRRFNVRFYLIAVLFLIFDVEVIFLIPWAKLFASMPRGSEDPPSAVVNTMQQMGYDQAFVLGSIGFFFVLLIVGLVYEWRKGIFRWD